MLFENIALFLPDQTVLENGFLETKGETITYLGEKKPQSNEPSFDGRGKLLLPGFVNTHGHVPMTLLRSLGSGLALDRWLNEAIFPRESTLSQTEVYFGALLGISEMIRSGVTSFNDMYYFSDQIVKAALESGISANIAMDGFAFREEIQSRFRISQDTLKEFYQQYHNLNHGQIRVDFCIHAEYTSDAKMSFALSELAKEHSAHIQLHLAETQKETKECYLRHQKTPAQFFYDLGVFDSPTTAAHCVYLNDEDRQLLAQKNVTVSHCPMSNLKLGSGIADIMALKKAGIQVTIGTDGVASNDNLNFLEDIKLASLLQKGLHQDPTLLPAGEVLTMATKNGALSQGRTDTGQLKVGYLADLVVVDFSSVNLQPMNDWTNELLYAALPSDVCLTMGRGKVLYENGRFKTLDIEKILSEIKHLTDKS